MCHLKIYIYSKDLQIFSSSSEICDASLHKVIFGENCPCQSCCLKRGAKLHLTFSDKTFDKIFSLRSTLILTNPPNITHTPFSTFVDKSLNSPLHRWQTFVII